VFPSDTALEKLVYLAYRIYGTIKYFV